MSGHVRHVSETNLVTVADIDSHLQKRILGFRPDFPRFSEISPDFLDLVDVVDFKPEIQTEGFTASRMAAVDSAATQSNFARICSQLNKLCLDLQPAK